MKREYSEYILTLYALTKINMEKEKNQKVAGAAANAHSTVANAHPEAVDAHHDADSNHIEALSDRDLYALCKKYGGKARLWAREFAFLLPEVARRGLHRKKGFESIYEFAGRLAGMSREVAYRVLSLHGKLRGMPKLWELLKSEGWYKLQLIATVATPQTEDYWVDKVSTMARATLQLFIQELKKQCGVPGQSKVATLFENLVAIENDKSGNFVYNKPGIAGAPNFCDKIAGTCVETPEMEASTETEILGSCDENPGTKIDTGIANDGEGNLTNASKLHAFRKLKFQVDGATEIDFRVFKSELEKVRKEAITMGEALHALLEIAELAKMLSRCMPREYRSMFPYWRA